ncbi:MAG: hypothetical protein AB1782_19970 [Cyanobacteriota bacterium]
MNIYPHSNSIKAIQKDTTPPKFFQQNKNIKQLGPISLRGMNNAGDQVSFGMALDPSKLKTFERWGLKLADKIPQSFYQGKLLNYIATQAKNYPGLFEALTALGVTCSIRPVTIMVVPGAKVEDRQYAAVKSIASGLVGYAMSYVAFKPLGDIISKLGNGAYDNILKKPFPFKAGTAQFNTFSFIINYGSKFLLAIPMAMATFKMIPWLMNKVFPDRKKKPLDNYNPPIAATKLDNRQQEIYDNFMQLSKTKGGVA